MPALPDVLTSEYAVAALIVVVLAAVAYQRTLSWPEYNTLHTLKRVFLPLVDRRTSLFVVSDKYRRGDNEYLGTIEASVPNVFRELTSSGGSPHLVNALKRRPTPGGGGVEYSAAHVVWFHNGFGSDQSEVYLFDNGDGTTDVYCHYEPSVTAPVAHLSGQQTDGDPKGVVRAALGANALTRQTEAN